MAALKDVQAAEKALADWRDRHGRAREAFRSRLEQAGLSEEDYLSLMPAVVTIDEYRATVEEHRRRLRNAEMAKKTAEDVCEQVRPDLDLLDAKRQETESKRAEATNLRARAWQKFAMRSNWLRSV